MLLLYILVAIGLLLLLILLLRVRILFSYSDTTDVSVILQILFFRFPIYPKQKTVQVRRYTYRRYRKRLLKQRQKEAKGKQPAATSSKARKKKTYPFKDNIRLYQYLLQRLYKRFLHHFRIDVAVLRISVATGDAAKTAIATGIVSQAVAYIVEILENHTNFHRGYRADISVVPDFLGEKSRASCNIKFSLRVFQIVDLGIRFFYHYLIGRMSRQASVKNKEEKTWQTAN